MSVLPKETVQLIAEMVGLAIKPEVSSALAQDAEYRLREIIQESMKFMRHSKRRKLLAEDIDSALKVRNVEPLYGFNADAPFRFKILPGPHPHNLYYLEDREIDLDELINASLPPVPLDIAFTGHWLAIEGVQPLIAQNPSPLDSEPQSAVKSALTSSSTTTTPQDQKILVKHKLSKELQLYYEKITESIIGPDDSVRDVALASIRKDPSIQPLLPYFVQYITEHISRNKKTLRLTWAMTYFIKSILDNPHLFIEPYLHQIMPGILTILVGKRLSENSSEDHWSVRDYAANLITHICTQYGSTYGTLQPRITKTLLRAFLDPTKPFATQYGAIRGLTSLGKEVVEVLLLPNIKSYGNSIEAILGKNVEENSKVSDAKMCQEAILDIIRDVEQSQSWNKEQSLEEKYGIFAQWV